MRLKSLFLAALLASGAAHANVTSIACKNNSSRNGDTTPQSITLKRDHGKGYTLNVDGQKFHVFGLESGYYEDNPEYQGGSAGLKGRFWFDEEHTKTGKVFLKEYPIKHGINTTYFRVEVVGEWLDVDGHNCKVKH